MPSFFIKTYGCQMNVSDSEKMRQLLRADGWEEAFSAKEAELIVVNSCAVRKKAEEKIFSYIGTLRSDQQIVLAGCVAQAERERLLKKFPQIKLLLGTHQYHEIARLVKSPPRNKTQLGFSQKWVEIVPEIENRTSNFSAYISIMEGCNHFCSYCIVPFTRGREKYRPLKAILAEAEKLKASGVKEVILLGQNVNAWHDADSGKDLADLLRLLANDGKFFWIRFITSYPSLPMERIAAAIAEYPNIARHLHLPAQSGSTRILRLMNRHYNRQDYLKTIELFKKKVPGIGFSSDFIVGFPQETDHDFQLTLSLLEKVGYENIFSFIYSFRAHTAAQYLTDNLPLRIKKERLQILQQKQAELQLIKNRQLIGKEIPVLVESVHPRKADERIARSEQHRVVNIKCQAAVGTILRVRITAAGPHNLRGEVI